MYVVSLLWTMCTGDWPRSFLVASSIYSRGCHCPRQRDNVKHVHTFYTTLEWLRSHLANGQLEYFSRNEINAEKSPPKKREMPTQFTASKALSSWPSSLLGCTLMPSAKMPMVSNQCMNLWIKSMCMRASSSPFIPTASGMRLRTAH